MNRNSLLPCAFLLLVSSPFALAQTGPPPPQQDGGHRPGEHMGQPGPQRGGDHMGGPGMGMGIVPPGTWWRNPEVIKNLTLTTDQQKRLDDIFLQSRIQLVHMKASLEEEQLKLEPLLNSNPPDSGKALAEISRIADLRAELEKGNARMLLGLRGVLTADQWTKLHTQDHGMGRGGDNGRGRKDGPDGVARGRRGPDGMGGPGAPGVASGQGGNLGNPPVPPSPRE